MKLSKPKPIYLFFFPHQVFLFMSNFLADNKNKTCEGSIKILHEY